MVSMTVDLTGEKLYSTAWTDHLGRNSNHWNGGELSKRTWEFDVGFASQGTDYLHLKKAQKAFMVSGGARKKCEGGLIAHPKKKLLVTIKKISKNIYNIKIKMLNTI